MAFQLVQIIYWLALATWFGGVFFVALTTPIIFRTARESNPILPTVLSVNLEGQHGTLMAGSIVANILQRLIPIELMCAGALLVALVLQMFLIDLSAVNLTMAVLRVALFLVATAVVIYEWRVLWPMAMKHRQEYLDHADEPEVANPALDRFDAVQRQSYTLLNTVVFLLLGMVLFSADIRRAPSLVLTNIESSGAK